LGVCRFAAIGPLFRTRRRSRLLKALSPALGATLVLVAIPSSALAQATRTWVSGVGDDANPCSRTAPCKTFAGAISKTMAGGEIDVLDPGGFGALTITKAITIDGGGGIVASALVGGGSNGIVIAAGANDHVILRNLRITGGANQGLNGIRVLSAKSVQIQNCEIFGFSSNGIDFAPSVAETRALVDHTTIYNNLGNGINAAPTGQGTDRVTATNDVIETNGNGVVASASGAPISLINTANSTIADNAGAGVLTNGSTAVNIITGNLITGNTNGLQLQTAGAGFLIALGNNAIFENVTDEGPGTPTSTIGLHAKDLAGQTRAINNAWSKAVARSRAFVRKHHKRHKRR
jgi:hypothetical protein